MENAALADKILTTLLDNHGNSATSIGHFLKLDKATVQGILVELKTAYKWFEEIPGDNNQDFTIRIKPGYEYIVRAFLQNEGFKGLERKGLEEKEVERKLNEQKQTTQRVTTIHAGHSALESAEALRLSKEACELAERSVKTASESIAKADLAIKKAEKANQRSLLSSLVTILAVLVAWYLGKHC